MDRLKKRPLFFILLSIVSSFAFAYFIDNNIKFWIAVVFLVIAGAAFFLPPVRLFSLFVLLPFAFGMFHHYLFVRFAYEPTLSFSGKEISVQGKLVSEHKQSANASYFVLRTKGVTCDEEYSEISGDIVVYTDKKASEIQIGSTVRCVGKVFENHKTQASFDYRLTEKQFISVYSEKITLLAKPKSSDLNVLCVRAREAIGLRYKEIFSLDSYALISGITLGDKDLIDDRTYFNFKAGGVAHTLAVSGMHLAILSMFLWFVLSILCPNLYVRAVLQLVLVWGFAFLTGLSPSCLRAAVMLSFYLVGVLIHKESDPLTSLLFAVAIACAGNPFAILNPSLALSSASTLGILLLGPRILSIFPQVKGFRLYNKVLRFAFNTVAISLAATIASFPIMAYMFGSVSILSPFTNVLIIPAIELLFVLGCFAVLFGFLPPIAFVLRVLASCLASYITSVMDWVACLPFGTVSTEGSEFWLIIVIIAIIITLLSYFWRMHPKRFAPLLLGMFSLYIILSFAQQYIVRDEIKVSVLDAGQGNSVMIHSSGHAVFIDCGGSGLGYQSIEKELLRFNIKIIDAIYFTHLDKDHICFAQRVLDTYPVSHVYFPKRAEYSDAVLELKDIALRRKSVVRYIDRDLKFSLWNDATLSVLTKHVDFYSDDENENSLVYQLNYGSTQALFMGDVCEEGEFRLISSYREKLQSEILLAPHHGSKSASSVELLLYVDPDDTVISVGKDNAYGLPNKYTVRQLERYSDRVHRTDEMGTVRFVLNQNDYARKG